VDQEHLRKIVDGSGYLLQIAVEHRVRKMVSQPEWSVQVTEHPWRRHDEPRFIDLVLGTEVLRLVVECKRPGGGEYTFLAPHGSRPAANARCRWVEYTPNRQTGASTEGGIYDFGSTSNTYEAAYAIVSGQDERKPILERLAAEAVEACDALAMEELDLAEQRQHHLRRIYIPTIVTTAPLYVVVYKPENIDPGRATLVGDFESVAVDSLWFRKSLTTELSENSQPADLKSANADRERSVLLIQASALEPTLCGLNIVGSPRQ
jgi:hypothetical protein